jgi:hypothetical protein
MRQKIIAVVLALAAFFALVPPANASFGFQELEFGFRDAGGADVNQAGSHPFGVVSKFELNTVPDPDHVELPDGGQLKDVVVELPPGLVGDPTAVPTCPDADFTSVTAWRSDCPNDSVVGIGTFHAAPNSAPGIFDAPIYNLDPPPGVALELGFVITTIPVTLDVRINPEPPYNAIATGTNVSEVGIVYGAELDLWGNPLDSAHDPLRGTCLAIERTSPDEPASNGDCPVEGIEEKALVTLPRACTGPLFTNFEADSWEQPGAWVSEETETPGMEGCEELGLDASIESQPTTQSASSSSGLDFDLNVEDEGLIDPSKNAGSDIQKAVVTLPEGVTVNPSQANGLGACTEAGYKSLGPASEAGEGCPESSKVGSVEVQTPLLEGRTLHGAIFLAEPYENPTNSLIGLYLTLREPQRGIFVKLAGKVEADARTGRLTTTFENLPQLPFGHFHLHFNQGPRAPLVTPSRCGTYATEALLTPWANPAEPVRTTSTFTIDSGSGGGPCPLTGASPFSPSFEAGTLNPAAGDFSPLVMRIRRSDAEQELSAFSAQLPPGLLAKIAGTSQCPQGSIEAAAARSGTEEKASPSCPAASRIGTTYAGAGVGPELTYVPGALYLAGPYRGAPLSVAAVVPALAGPFDLGTVVVQEGLTVNPVSGEAEITTATPLPRILSGIPLALRDLRIVVDRPQFTLNATGCETESTRATLWGAGADPLEAGDELAVATVARYQATGCRSLDFKPRFSLVFKGSMRRTGNPAITTVVRPRGGDSNIGRAVVKLPPSELIDNAHINNPCTRVQFSADACPKKSILGHARAITPLLDSPLEGPVYFRSNGGERELPDIVADLRGQFHIVLIGFIDSNKGSIRTTFASVPDAPVTKFTLRLYGGRRGLLENNSYLCRHEQRIDVRLEGHNGRRYQLQPRLRKPGCHPKK